MIRVTEMQRALKARPNVLKFQLILTTFTSTFGGFVEQLSQTNVAQLSVTQYITMIVRILVTPKAGAKH